MDMKAGLFVACAVVAVFAAVSISAYALYVAPLEKANGNNVPRDPHTPIALPGSPDTSTSSPVQQTPPQAATPPSGTPIVAQGRIVCLPHKNTDGPQTMECAFGLRTDAGVYYALSDTDPNYENVSGAPMDARVEVEGTFATRQSSNYQDIGIISVTRISKL